MTARRVLSVWLAFHLAAIVIAPASVAPTSDLIGVGWRAFRPYLQTLYLDHGYHFFAPEPGPSTLLSYAAERPDGTVVRGRIPDLATARPRLLYHRQFMLTEHMLDAPPELETLWFGSYARHIGRTLGASRVTLTRQSHGLPSMEMVRNGVGLDDPESYEDHALGAFRCDEF